ncbi:PepSY domain-containing protein [Sphingomonas panni]|uniref:PepSY domain-containing protein n=1 Tax=Sphingomonas panni TaxID=237612 RepID=UPI001F5B03CB|nr:PepSY domain-containing protein [Sphingomonas panni]
MSMVVRFLVLGLLAVSGNAHALPDQLLRDHQAARAARDEGRILPMREIERRVLPQMRGAQYLGFDYDPDRGIYTLKFLRDGAVIWVDVDARTGQVTGRSR